MGNPHRLFPAQHPLPVRARARGVDRRTHGDDPTQVVEEALRSYQPVALNDLPTRLVRKGGILVKLSGGQRVTLEQANAALHADRSERPG